MKVKHSKLPPSKTLLLVSAALLLVMMPEDIAHLLAGLVHFIYESIAFAIEELLTHGLGLSKFHAQMIVFYSSLAIGVLLAFWLIRRIPRLLIRAKACAQWAYLQTRAYFLCAWQRFYTRWKLELMLAQVVSIASVIVWTLI